VPDADSFVAKLVRPRCSYLGRAAAGAYAVIETALLAADRLGLQRAILVGGHE
jgi:hypothetical protein